MLILYFYQKNAMNDITGIMDENFTFVCGYHYDAWGNITKIIGNTEIAEANPFRYKGYYYDSDLRMYYLHTRYYDSVTGRFISSDDLNQLLSSENNLNLYAYCNNNPVNYEDAEGTHRNVLIMTISEFESESKNIPVLFIV